MEDQPVLVLFDGWTSLFRDRVVPWRIGMAEKTRTQFETETLPRHIEAQRWYGSKGTPLKRARLVDHVLWQEGTHEWLLSLLELDGPPERPSYFMPLALAWEEQEDERLKSLAALSVARVRQQANVGLIGDAFADEVFCRAVVRAIGENKQLATAHGKLQFRPTRAFARLAGDDYSTLPVGRPQAQSSNTLVTLGERLFLKGYRRLRPGLNPEVETGRFLTDVAHYPNCVPLAGSLEYAAANGTTMTLALVQAYVSNQGDGWTYTLNYLERFLEEWRTSPEKVPADVHGAYMALVQTLGTRTAELHRAFAQRTGDPAFDPEPVTPDDLAAYGERVAGEARTTFSLLEGSLAQLAAGARNEAQSLLAARERLLARIGQLAAAGQDSLKTRFHGDFHLGQVLLTKNDFVIIDFEGEPLRGFDERRAKQSPLRDVAGMLRSFSYARWSALQRIARKDDIDRLAPLASAWEAEARDAFRRAYDDAVRSTPLYGGHAPDRSLLALFELEKALYELRYEIGNRPDWAHIPLHGLLRIAGPAAAPAESADTY